MTAGHLLAVARNEEPHRAGDTQYNRLWSTSPTGARDAAVAGGRVFVTI